MSKFATQQEAEAELARRLGVDPSRVKITIGDLGSNDATRHIALDAWLDGKLMNLEQHRVLHAILEEAAGVTLVTQELPNGMGLLALPPPVFPPLVFLGPEKKSSS